MWAAAAAWMAGVAAVSLAPGVALGAGTDAWWHGAAYLVLAWLLRCAMAPDRQAAGWVLPLAAAWSFGLVLEGLQAALPYRTAEARDLLANAAGAGIAMLLPVRWHRWAP